MDQQISWNNLSNSAMFTSESNMSYIDLTTDDPFNMNTTWTSVGPTSNVHTLEEHGWASSLIMNDGLGLRTEESQLRSNNTHPLENLNYSPVNIQANDNFVHNNYSSNSGSTSRGVDVIENPFNACILSRKRKEIDGSYTSESSSSVYHQGESSSMHHNLSTHQNANTALRIGSSNLETAEYRNYSFNGSQERSNRNRRVRINHSNQWDAINNHSPSNQEINNQFGSLNLSNQSSAALAQNMHSLCQSMHPLSMTMASSSRAVNLSNPTTRGQTLALSNPFSYPQVTQQVGNQPSVSSLHSGSSQNISVPPHSSGFLNTNSHESSSQSVVSSIQESSARVGNGIMSPELTASRSQRRRILAEHFQNELARRGELISLEDLLILNRVLVRGRSMESHDRHRDMRLDVDNMSYEELLALEERIGDVNTGLGEKKIMECLKRRIYISLEENPSDVEPCCICQELYMEEEDVGRLNCGHDFHTACIKQWLMRKNLCPICKTTGLA